MPNHDPLCIHKQQYLQPLESGYLRKAILGKVGSSSNEESKTAIEPDADNLPQGEESENHYEVAATNEVEKEENKKEKNVENEVERVEDKKEKTAENEEKRAGKIMPIASADKVYEVKMVKKGAKIRKGSHVKVANSLEGSKERVQEHRNKSREKAEKAHGGSKEKRKG
ncbi:hypothetical protein GCK32_020321, partial [Trichostrongylus colubriformis]